VAENYKISIDTDVLRRCSADLERVAAGLAQASASISGSPISARAFGTMNAWVVDPVATVSSRSAELIELSGKVISAVATATDDAARDTEQTEETVLGWVRELDAQLDQVTKDTGP
jgi:predicted trehalose synthase